MGIHDDRAATRPGHRRARDPGTRTYGVPGADPGLPRSVGGKAASDARCRGYDVQEDRSAGGDLAAGSDGDWAASACGSGQRRGPGAGDTPYLPDPAFDPAAWPGDRSLQQRFGRPPAPAGGPAAEARPGPRGWRRSDESLHERSASAPPAAQGWTSQR
jgi:hypothetical protein